MPLSFWRLGAADCLRKSLCLLLLILSASIFDKNNDIDELISIFFIFHYCLINLKIIYVDTTKRI